MFIEKLKFPCADVTTIYERKSDQKATELFWDQLFVIFNLTMKVWRHGHAVLPMPSSSIFTQPVGTSHRIK